MKKFLILCTGLAFALTTATALAADLTGTWSGEMPGQNGGTFHISYTFKQDGAKLTGFVKSPQGDLIQIPKARLMAIKSPLISPSTAPQFCMRAPSAEIPSSSTQLPTMQGIKAAT